MILGARARLMLTTLGLLLSLSTAVSQSPSRASMEEWAKPEIDQIPSIVQKIKECPSNSTTVNDGEATLILRIVYNVTWDVVPNPSIRAPYSGSIDFVVGQRLDTDFAKCQKAHQLAGCASYAKDVNSQPPVKYRYEFDLSPGGLNFQKKLSRKESDGNWADDPLDTRYCWDKAVAPEEKSK